MIDSTVQQDFNQPKELYPLSDMMRIALLVEYCGSPFKGSQFQPEQPTIQASLEQALHLLNIKTPAVNFASRTDAGVHARGQVAHFDTTASALSNIDNLPAALNAVLPHTIAVRADYRNTGPLFNSQRDALCKWYRYRIYNAPHRSVWAGMHTDVYHHRPALDIERFHQAAQLLLGVHDFSSFQSHSREMPQPVCHVYGIQAVRDGDFINFDIAADRFLYKMVRNIVGQLLLISRVEKPLPIESILEVMASRDRRQAAAPARPEGLTLMAMLHKSPFNFFAQDIYVRQLETMLNPTKMESLPHENLFRKAS